MRGSCSAIGNNGGSPRLISECAVEPGAAPNRRGVTGSFVACSSRAPRRPVSCVFQRTNEFAAVWGWLQERNVMKTECLGVNP